MSDKSKPSKTETDVLEDRCNRSQENKKKQDKKSSPGGTRTPDQGIMSSSTPVKNLCNSSDLKVVDRKKDRRLWEVVEAWSNLPESRRHMIHSISVN